MLILIEHAQQLLTMDEQRREIADGALLIKDNVILHISSSDEMSQYIHQNSILIDKTINASGSVLMPGLINCHHHLYQTLTRTLGTGNGLSLFDWLKKLYPIWGQMDAESVYISAKLGLIELILSGATTVADHLYLFPNGSRLDDEIAAAQELGVRFHPTRGSMSLGESLGGLPPDHLVEEEQFILDESQRVIETFHDDKDFSMCRVGLAPCSPFSVTGELMRQSAKLAREYNSVNLHTHLAETIDENRFCVEKFGMRPLEYMDSLGWLGDDVWFAHMVHPNEDEIKQLAHSCSGVCHCPSSNMILASGIAPIRDMVDADVRVGLGVDGSASNDANHMLGEARQTMLLQRVGWPGFESSASRFSARDALELATLGGAKVLQRGDIGSLSIGKAADMVAFKVDDLYHAGGQSDVIASLLTCGSGQVDLSIINGKVIVEHGELLCVDIDQLVIRHNELAHQLLVKEHLV